MASTAADSRGDQVTEGSAGTGDSAMNIRARLLTAIDASGLTDRKLSMRATGGTDTIRNIRRGANPRADTLEKLCHAMSLDLQIIPAPKLPDNAHAGSVLFSPTVFSENRDLPVYEWTDPSEDGHRRRTEEPTWAPAPPEVSDEQAFYVQMPDDSMTPAEIRKHDYCLVSPCSPVRVDQRMWLRMRTGREMIKWVLRLTPDGFDLGAWDPEKTRQLAPAASFSKREDIVERGAVIAAYREQPALSKILEPHAIWRPGLLADLWRSAQFSIPLRATADQLDQVLSAVGQLENELKHLSVRGEISDSQSRQVLRALAFIIDEGRESITRGTSSTTSEASRTSWRVEHRRRRSPAGA